MSVTISVVVPTYKRPELLSRCLEALLSQEYNPADFEILVVDDAADEKTRVLVEEFSRRLEAYAFTPGKRKELVALRRDDLFDPPLDLPPTEIQGLIRFPGMPRLRYLPMTHEHGPAAARNAGWRAAEGKIIAFTDDDCLPTSGWLRAGVSAFQDGVAGVSGQIIMPLSAAPTDYERDASGLERSAFVTANCFYRKAALQTCGGFDTAFKMAWREDTDLFFNMLERGYRLEFDRRAVVIHPVRPGRWGISVSQQKKSQYNALLYKKHPNLYWKRVQTSPPWLYYAIVASGLMVLPGWLLAGSGAGLGALVAWLAMTAYFVVRRLSRTSHTLSHILEMILTSIVIPPLSIYWRITGSIKYRVLFI